MGSPKASSGLSDTEMVLVGSAIEKSRRGGGALLEVVAVAVDAVLVVELPRRWGGASKPYSKRDTSEFTGFVGQFTLVYSAMRLSLSGFTVVEANTENEPLLAPRVDRGGG